MTEFSRMATLPDGSDRAFEISQVVSSGERILQNWPNYPEGEQADFAEVDVRAVAAEAVADSMSLAAERGVVLALPGNNGPAVVRGNPDLLRILCRNLMIYLVPEARRRLLRRLRDMLRPGGLLFVGHAEVAAVRATGLELASPPEAWK